MTMPADVRAKFEAEAKRLSDGYKTGSFYHFKSESLIKQFEARNLATLGGSVDIDWYVTRGEVRTPVIRVCWHEPSHAYRRVRQNGRAVRTKAWGFTKRSQPFPFTVEGLEAAITFAETI